MSNIGSKVLFGAAGLTVAGGLLYIYKSFGSDSGN